MGDIGTGKWDGRKKRATLGDQTDQRPIFDPPPPCCPSGRQWKVSIENTDDKVGKHEGVKSARLRRSNATDRVSFHLRIEMSWKQNTPKMSWKLKKVMGPVKKSVCASFMVI